MPTKTLINGHKRFKSNFKKKEKLFLNLAKKGQKPKVLWIGCSDSRVIPEQIMEAAPGELFVHRNIANIIPPQESKDFCTGSILEYAVIELKVSNIIICGHTECGGIGALINDSQSSKDSAISHWLEYAHPARERILSKKSGKDLDSLEVIKENALLQREHLLTYRFINEKYDSGKLIINTWLYDLHTGKILYYCKDKNTWTELV